MGDKLYNDAMPSVRTIQSKAKNQLDFIDNRHNTLPSFVLIKKRTTSNQVTNNIGSVIQAFGLANVVLGKNDESYYVANLNFKERVPTTTSSSSQGDHTVAEVLIEASFKSLVPNTINGYLEGLAQLMLRHITPDVEAMHTDESSNESYKINANDVFFNIQDLLEEQIDPYFCSQILSDVTTKVWRLFSKRPYTAFEKEEGLTTGGGKENAAKKALLETAVPYLDWRTNDYINEIAGIAIGFVDVNADSMDDEMIYTIIRRASEHVGDMMGIESADWKNRLAANIYTRITGKAMLPKPAPYMGW